MVKQVSIELPGIVAISRNMTTGHYFNYKSVLNEAEAWMQVFGKTKEFHFEKQVDVFIEAYYNVTGRKKICDPSNIDDKIFIDTLIRFKRQKSGPPIERKVWFLADDSPKYIRDVTKRAIRSDHYKVVITIKQVEDENSN